MAPDKKGKERKVRLLCRLGYVTDEPMEQMACYNISFDRAEPAPLHAHDITRPYSQSCTVSSIKPPFMPCSLTYDRTPEHSREQKVWYISNSV